MIGNLWEWTNEWYASVGAVTSPTARPAVLEDGGVVTGSAVLAPPSLNASITGTRVNYDLSPWPANSGYGDGRDITRNITSTVGSETGDVTGMPAVAIRGGGWGIGATAGTFALSLTAGPSARDQYTGFRCVIPR